MTNFSQSWKHDQVFISFRGRSLRNNLVSNLKEELKRSNINFFNDECATRGSPIATLFQRIRESGVALVLFSNKYPESCWCLDELVEIKKQVETGYLNVFPIFYEVDADSVKRQTGCFGNTLLKTEDYVRNKVDRGSYKSILETEAMIWGWRQALVYIGGILGVSHKRGHEQPLISNIVVKLKVMLDEISYRRSGLFIIEKSLVHPQKAVTPLLQALNLKKSDLEDLITRPFIYTKGSVSLRTDHLVFLDLISLKNPVLARRFIERGQSGRVFLVLLGSLDVYDEEFDIKPLLLSKKPQLFPGNELTVSSQETQNRNYSLPVEVTSSADVVAMVESNDNTQSRLGEDNNSDDALTCFSFLCNIMKRCAMMINPPPSPLSPLSPPSPPSPPSPIPPLSPLSPLPPPHKVFISFGEKQLAKNLVSNLKNELTSNGISVYVEDETKEKEEIKESRVAIVVFSGKYPESLQCLDELVEIKKLMESGAIDPFPVFYSLKADLRLAPSVKELKGYFRNRLLKIEEKVRNNVNRGNVNSILDTEARIWGWRQALLSISSRPGLSNEQCSDPVFFTNVVTKVKELFSFERPKKPSSDIITNQLNEEKALMHQQEIAAAITTFKSFDDHLFYSLDSFLQALDFQITDLQGFTDIPKGLVSLRLKRHTNLVCLNLGCLENLVQFQRSLSFEFLTKGFTLNSSGISRFEGPSRLVALESNQPQQCFDNRLIVSPRNHQHHINHFPVQTSKANMF